MKRSDFETKRKPQATRTWSSTYSRFKAKVGKGEEKPKKELNSKLKCRKWRKIKP